jgi:ribonuclease P protein component
VTRRTGRFKPVDRILESRDFRRISREGRRTAAHDFVLILSASREDDGRRRLGVSVSRRVGNAVVRNYVKRCVREWFRRERERLPRSSDVVVIARRPAADLDSRQIAQALDELVARALRKAFTT